LEPRAAGNGRIVAGHAQYVTSMRTMLKGAGLYAIGVDLDVGVASENGNKVR
jgi:hypothetical protein